MLSVGTTDGAKQMNLQAIVKFVPAYWNRTCFCNIPARWTAEIIEGLSEGLMIYSDGCQSRKEAIEDLIIELKRRNLTGKLKIVNG